MNAAESITIVERRLVRALSLVRKHKLKRIADVEREVSESLALAQALRPRAKRTAPASTRWTWMRMPGTRAHAFRAVGDDHSSTSECSLMSVGAEWFDTSDTKLRCKHCLNRIG